MKKIHVIIYSFTILAFLGSCNSKKEEKVTEKKEYLVTKPIIKDTTVIKDYVCQIKSINHIELRALESGYVQKILVDEGKEVKKGQLMFVIMPVLYQAEYEKAKAEAEYVKIEYLNTKALADNNVVSKNELALAKAKLDKANAELNLAKGHLGFTEIRAPFDGIMDRLEVRKGSLVEDGELLTHLSDNSTMWVYFNVPEAEYLNYKQGIDNNNDMNNVHLLLANKVKYELPGKISTIEADFNNETGNIAFRANFPNPKRLLRHGETGTILMTSHLPGATIIPQKASFQNLDKNFIFVVNDKGEVIQKEIKIKQTLQDVYVLEEGNLNPDEIILIEGIRKVEQGDIIKKKYIDPAQVISHLKYEAE